MSLDFCVTVSERAGRATVDSGSTAALAAYIERCVPFHEAAHCVVALHFRLPVRYVTIRRAEAVEASGDPNAAGHTALMPYAGEAGPLACVAFAGIVSDATFGLPGWVIEGDPSAALAAVACHSSHDFEIFRQLMPTPQAQREVSRLTHSILRRNRDRVVAVGRALRAAGRLTGEEVAAAMRRAGL